MPSESDWKEGPRIKASRPEWQALQEAKRGPCRVSGLSPHMGVELHHLVPRSQGGDDVADNLVPLSREIHRKVEANEYETRSRLRVNLTEAEVNYCVDKKGWAWLERRYPMPDLLQREPEDVLPGKPCPTCKRRVPTPFKGEKKLNRVTFSLKVPKTEQENGHEVLTSLIDQAAEKLGKPGQPPYHTLIPVLYSFVLGESLIDSSGTAEV